jgi:hypothetical protein
MQPTVTHPAHHAKVRAAAILNSAMNVMSHRNRATPAAWRGRLSRASATARTDLPYAWYEVRSRNRSIHLIY